ncbi:SUKH-4 immunity protein [Micromonospora rhizosphaerae]|uniref:SUKH-4 immunity protein n=1 Tax=Micromonospora rhizosphaerae TaxID=568872 RepID=A0A1C6RUC1_9ACTN|nr:SUKH-4 immunity protein [Micromonospora rhizosphaerae]
MELGVEFVTYEGEAPHGCSEAIWGDLCRIGLPKIAINIFKPSLQPVPVSAEVAGGRTGGIVIGYSREGAELYLDFESENVWLLWRGDSSHTVVNTSLGAFRESLLQVDARYPFYPSNRNLEMAEEAEAELRQILVEIDGIATADPDGFWSAFLDDVAVGDYAAQESPDL